MLNKGDVQSPEVHRRAFTIYFPDVDMPKVEWVRDPFHLWDAGAMHTSGLTFYKWQWTRNVFKVPRNCIVKKGSRVKKVETKLGFDHK